MPPPYSKSQVDRAGRFVAEQIAIVAKDPKHAEGRATLGEIGEAIDVIDWWRTEHGKSLSRVAANLRYYAQGEGDPIVTQRLKRTPTIAGKLVREPKMKLSRMADIGGVRLIAPDQSAAYRIATRLRRNWTITRLRDYVTEPKSDGYRALHLINRHRGRLIEIQLRTKSQDTWANGIERLSRTAYPGLKFGQGPKILRDTLRDFAEIFARVDQELISSEEGVALAKARVSGIATLLEDSDES
jgi:putative GTP pyrophosphokinase